MIIVIHCETCEYTNDPRARNLFGENQTIYKTFSAAHAHMMNFPDHEMEFKIEFENDTEED